MSGKRTAREHVLLALFAASLAWALLQSAAMLMLLVGVGEDCVLPYGAEHWAPPVVAAVAAGLIDIFLVRRAPGFLRLPARVTLLRLSLSLIVTTIIVAAVLFVGPIAVSALFNPPGPRPDDVQHVPLVFCRPRR
jgi:hypothetical protein